MTSTIKVDTISENTSANGVAVDGVTLKDGGIAATAASTITTADNLDTLSLVSTDADGNSGPNLRMYRNSGSPADGDELGVVQFEGRNDNSQDVIYAEIKATLADASDGTEDAVLNIKKMVAGTLKNVLKISETEAVFNEGSVDLDFRVESNGNANAIFVNGGTDSVTIGASGVVQTLAGIPFYRNDTSSIYTHDVSGTDDTAALNTAYGITALDAITTGDNNTVVGSGAGSALNTGHRNTLMGQGAGNLLTTATHTVAIGNAAASGYDTETHNLAIGHVALGGSVAGGEFNVAIGNLSLDALTSADNNVAIGYEAGGALTTGGENVIIGSYAVSTGVLTGAQNIVIGRLAGQDLTSATKNTIVGWSAAKQATTADENTYIGYLAAGTGIGTSAYNVAIGNEAAEAATSMSESTVVGYKAATANTTGSHILAIGYTAYDVADTENHNLAIGTNALGGAVAGGEYNVAVGNYTLDALTSGDHNIAMGYNAGTTLSTGGHNVVIGNAAGGVISTGGANICIGSDAGNAGTALTTGDTNIFIGQSINAGASGRLRSIVIGTTSSSSKGDNTTFISANGGESFNGANTTTWNQASDIRIKKNIIDNNTGLDAINKIQVRNFEYRTLEEITDFDSPEAAMVDKQGTQLGVIAQEIEEILPNLITETSQGVKTLNSDNLTWYLINAVKELSAEIKVLKGE